MYLIVLVAIIRDYFYTFSVHSSFYLSMSLIFVISIQLLLLIGIILSIIQLPLPCAILRTLVRPNFLSKHLWLQFIQCLTNFRYYNIFQVLYYYYIIGWNALEITFAIRFHSLSNYGNYNTVVETRVGSHFFFFCIFNNYICSWTMTLIY